MERVSGPVPGHDRAHILVVDDDPDVAWLLRRTLTSSGYQVSVAHDGVGALAELKSSHFDLAILDVSMPKCDGIQVCLRLRAEPGIQNVPVLFLTGRDSLEDRLLGFEVGCDDYLVKPFHIEELLAHVKALLRRSRIRRLLELPPRVEPSTRLETGALSLDLQRRTVTCTGKTVQLTPSEFNLLRFFMEHPNEILSSRTLTSEVLGYPEDAIDTGAVRWHIKNLRSKIEPDPLHPTYIRTVPHHGYVFDESPPT